MTAFFPVFLLITIPGELSFRRRLVQSRESFDYAAVYFQSAADFATSPIVFLSGLLTIVSVAYFFFCMIAVMRTVHDVGRLRGFLIVAIGSVGWLAASALVEIPTSQMFWQAFQDK
jgi:hypothetical protein